MASGPKSKRQRKKEETKGCNYAQADVGLIRDCRTSSLTKRTEEEELSPSGFKKAEIIARTPAAN